MQKPNDIVSVGFGPCERCGKLPDGHTVDNVLYVNVTEVALAGVPMCADCEDQLPLSGYCDIKKEVMEPPVGMG